MDVNIQIDTIRVYLHLHFAQVARLSGLKREELWELSKVNADYDLGDIYKLALKLKEANINLGTKTTALIYEGHTFMYWLLRKSVDEMFEIAKVLDKMEIHKQPSTMDIHQQRIRNMAYAGRRQG